MSDQFKQLTYSHQQIQELLDRVSKGYLLSPDEYKYLMNKIGLENISIFDGNYDNLINKPDIDLIIKNFINLNNEEISKELKEEVAWILKLCRNELDIHISKYEELKNQIDEGLIAFDEEMKDFVIDAVIDSIDNLDNDIKDKLADIETKIEEVNRSKADESHMHLSGEIEGLPAHIEQTNADIKTLYEEAHIHLNNVILNSISEEDIERWNKKIGTEELSHSVNSAMANAAITLNLANKNYVDSQDDILQTYLEDNIEQKYVKKIDYESYINQNKKHVHCIDDIYMSTVEMTEDGEIITVSGSPYTIKQSLDSKVSKITEIINGVEVETHTLIEKELLRQIKKHLFENTNQELKDELIEYIDDASKELNIKINNLKNTAICKYDENNEHFIIFNDLNTKNREEE